MKKIVCLLLLVCMSMTLLTGCGSNGRSAKEVLNIPAITFEEIASRRLLASSNTTNSELDSSIYDYLSGKIVVDGSKLTKVTAKDEANINALLENINIQLCGKGGNALTEYYANYLLLEFARTPYEWYQSNKNIVGFDPATRLYFVDVTYSTTNELKTPVPNSKITLGHPDANKKFEKRYGDYVNMVLEMFNSGELSDEYTALHKKFVENWGEVKEIQDEQQGVSLLARTQELASKKSTMGIGRLTYSGLIRDNNFQLRGANMTVRYILKYSLNLGEETDLSVEALYLKDYEIHDSEKLLNSYVLKDKAALEVLEPFVDKVILSYNKCVEESNHIGLCKLFTDYSTIDKYYDEISNYTYNSIGTYNYKILERKQNGKEIAVKVQRYNQIRARGADMSLPTYEETLIFNMRLGANDTVTIEDVYLVKSKLIGEPLSVIKNVTGISEQIQYSNEAFSDTNKQKVLELLKNFSAVVTNGTVDTPDFYKCVDVGVSQLTVNRIGNTITAIVPKTKTTYLISWNTATNVYCSVTIREIFECNNGNFDTEAVVDMTNKNGEWRVVNYTRTLNIKTANAIVNTESVSALCKHTREADGEVTTIDEVTEKKDVQVNTPTNIEREDKPLITPEQSEEEVNVGENENIGVSSGGNVSEPIENNEVEQSNDGSSSETTSTEIDLGLPSGGSGDFD